MIICCITQTKGILVEKNAANLKLMGVRFASISGNSGKLKKTDWEFPGLWVKMNAANLKLIGVRFASISGDSSSNQSDLKNFEFYLLERCPCHKFRRYLLSVESGT